jgi:xanthine/uracil permease
MRTQTIPFRSFMANDYKETAGKTIAKVISAAGPALILIVPKSAMAAAVDSTFGNIHSSVMNIFDSGVVLVIIFAGAAWGLGHRTKAIEILIGVCCGYILARHAVDIRDFLKSI